MNASQIALQLYTIRDYLQTPADVASSLAKVRQIGYEAVQLSGVGNIPDEELIAICKGEGLTICATHEPPARILDQPARVAERLHRFGCRYAAYPYPSGIDLTNRQGVASLIRNLDAAGENLRSADCQLCYHNHAVEFVRFGSSNLLEEIFEGTKPDNLHAELDTYWVQYGGGNPTAWCRRLTGRLSILHCKDYAFTSSDKPVFAEVGSGNLEWKSILAAAEEAGCKWFAVEQDICLEDPFVCIKRSYDFLKENFC